MNCDNGCDQSAKNGIEINYLVLRLIHIPGKLGKQWKFFNEICFFIFQKFMKRSILFIMLPCNVEPAIRCSNYKQRHVNVK